MISELVCKCGKPPCVEDILLGRAEAYMRANLSKPLNLTVLADELGVSYHTLRDRYWRSRRMSLNQFWTAARLREAARLLAQPGMSVKRAALEVGMTPQHFDRVFRKHFGVSPMHFRRRALTSALASACLGLASCHFRSPQERSSEMPIPID